MTNSANIVVWAADIGSVAQNNFGWCRADSQLKQTSGSNIADAVAGIAQDLSDGKQVALGFECPLFVPITTNPQDLTKSRQGEGSRPWSAGAGSGALATGLTECVWMFEQIKN